VESVGRMTASRHRQSADFWPGRGVFVTGATGIVGCWLVKDLLSQGAHVVALVRDADLQSELYRSGDIRRVSVVNGALRISGRRSGPLTNMRWTRFSIWVRRRS